MAMSTEKAVNKPAGFLKNPRYERKFVLEQSDVEAVIQNQVLTNIFGFQEIFNKRTVNNIYFDDNNQSFYHENVSGTGWRKKVRLRWYGTDFLNPSPITLEIKKKYGEVGDKISYKLREFELNLRNTNPLQIKSNLIEYFQHSNMELANMFYLITPTLFNSYERRYFLSSCGRFRITIDYNLKYFNPNYTIIFDENALSTEEIILELKYDLKYDDDSRNISQHFYERLSKNSKYVRGCDIIYS
jgi:SPX domain protein involved in polyphosphate accumulation